MHAAKNKRHLLVIGFWSYMVFGDQFQSTLLSKCTTYIDHLNLDYGGSRQSTYRAENNEKVISTKLIIQMLNYQTHNYLRTNLIHHHQHALLQVVHYTIFLYFKPIVPLHILFYSVLTQSVVVPTM